jgi:hypothetical protein
MAKTEVVPIPTMPPPVPAAAPAAARPAATVAVPIPRPPVTQQLRKTLTNVRALPLWKRHIPPAIFYGIVALLAVALIGVVVGLKVQQPTVPDINRAEVQLRARQRQLRLQGEMQLRQGRVADAYTTYTELQRTAPKSPFVANVLQKLNAIRKQEEISKQQLATARQKYEQGVLLLNEKKYPEAIVLLQESFSINPNSIEAGEALKLAQLEQQKAEQARLLARQQRQASRQQQQQQAPRTDTAAAGTTTQAPVAAEPAQLTTVFQHPFTDGRILVRVGGEIVANEQLFSERRRRVIGTLARQPRPIGVTGNFPARSADVEVLVTVPAAGVNERHTFPGARFDPGRSYRLVVRYNPTTKAFKYELN